MIGREGQERLRRSTIMVIGLGGLGSIISMYLAGAGVGRLILIDYDTVSLSDLHRQLLYTMDDLGKPKADAASSRLNKINPEVKVEAYRMVFSLNDPDSVRLVEESDVLVLAVDNFKTRLDANELAVKYGKPLVNGGVNGWYGLVTTVLPGKTPCLFELTPYTSNIAACVEGLCNAVIGPVVGIVASWESLEALRLASGLQPVLAGRLLFIDGSRGFIDIIEVSRNPNCPVCGLKKPKDN